MSIYIGTTEITQSGRGLPSTYQEVEYIQSSGTQYINTGYVLKTNPGIDIDLSFIGGDSNSWIPIYGSRNDSYGVNNGNFCLYVNSSSLYVTPNYAGFDPGTGSGLVISSNTKYNIVNDKGQFYIDGVYKSTCSTTNTYTSVVDRNFLLFANNNYDGSVQIRSCSMKLYGCKLYNDGTLVRNFVPCYRKSDSVIGLYDLVNNQFYTNAGTGTFTKGSNVTAKGIYVGTTPVKEIYVGTTKVRPVWKPNANTLAYYPLTASTTVNDMSGNGHTLSNSGGVTFGTSAGVSCASNDSTKYLSGDLGTKLSNGDFTINFYVYRTGGLNSSPAYMFGSNTNDGAIFSETGDSKITFCFWNDDLSSTGFTLQNNTRYNICCTYNKTSKAQKLYINGGQNNSRTATNTLNLANTTFRLFRFNLNWNDYVMYGNLSNFIIENKERTSLEISNYYNQTKSNYGL